MTTATNKIRIIAQSRIVHQRSRIAHRAPMLSIGIAAITLALGFVPVSALTRADQVIPAAPLANRSFLPIAANADGPIPPAPPNTGVITRLSAGGSSVSFNGQVWSGDRFFVGGKPTSNDNVTAIAGTEQDELYFTARTSSEPLGSFSYRIPVPESRNYVVRLHFAEIYWGVYAPAGPGKRVFNVDFENGAARLTNYDIAREAAPMTAVIKDFTVPVNDGTLNIDFRASVDQPLVSAIEVLTTSPPAPPARQPLTPLTWANRAPAPLGRTEAQGIVVNNKLYVLGGFYNAAEQTTDRADVYDPATDTWTRLANVPEKLTHAAVAEDGQGNIYLIGGYVGDHPGPSTAKVWKYSIASNAWSAGPSLPEARGAGAAARIGGRIYYVGGAVRTSVQNTVDRPTHYVLDLTSGTWSSKTPMPNPRNHLGAVALGDKLYAIGGQHAAKEATQNQSQVDVYDPGTDTWTQAAQMPNARGHVSASTFVHNNQIIVAGGSVDGSLFGLASAEVTAYNPAANTWTRLSPLPDARKTPVGGAVGGELIVTTGDGPSGSPDPNTTNWRGRLASP